MAHDSQIARAKKNLKLSYCQVEFWSTAVGPANEKHQTSTNGLKLYVRDVIESEACPTVVQLKRKPFTMIFTTRHADLKAL